VLALDAVHGMPGFVGARQVAHHQHGLEPVAPRGIRQQRIHIARRQSHARHAGIELQRGRQAAAMRAAGSAPVGNLGRVVQHRNQAGFDEFGGGAGRRAVQHIDRAGVGQHLAQAHAFFQVGGEEHAAALERQRRRNVRHAQAIRIGFEDRGAGGRAGSLTQEAVIGAHRRQVDRQHRAGAGGVH
jgi:hypothetical protein